ncbi:hypothetical protein LCGC14_1768760 [marine sediment metagenome]|uniref:Uncharacterized protein n=1 Tax=marine sediment metagenome TaxID=412755 RepID=A0A0F9JDT6_9ZZZZ
MRWYVGHKIGGGREVFKAASEPTQATHGSQYCAAWGPFKTKRGAIFGTTHHAIANPHVQTVDDAERGARALWVAGAPTDCGCDACVMPSRRYATDKPIAHVPRPFMGSAVIILSDDDVAR